MLPGFGGDKHSLGDSGKDYHLFGLLIFHPF